MSKTGSRRGWRTGRVAIAAGAVIAAGAATIAANGVGLANVFGGDDASKANQSNLPPATARITKETLVDTVTRSGDLGFGDTTTVYGRLAGTVTGLPVTGAEVKRGQAIYKIDDRPVVLLYGKLPAYRELTVGTKGSDVEQFEQNLSALGYDGFTVDNEYTSSTASAVKQWQDDNGLSETGKVELGRAYYATGQVRVDAYKTSLGNAISPGSPVLNYTGSSQVVSVELPFDYRQLAKKGAPVTVQLPDDKTVPGKISDATTVIKQATSGQEEDTTVIDVSVTVQDPKVLAGLDQVSLDVAFHASERVDVLTVPVAALLALSEGGYGVQLVEGSSTRLIAVQTGLFAGGRVEVSGNGVTQGALVGMPA